MDYPFTPRSTTHLRPGQFWAFRLSDGRFACGRVAQVGASEIPGPTRLFFSGLQDWVGDAPPAADDLAGGQILAWSVMHIRAILRLDGRILGERPLSADGITLPLQVASRGGRGVNLLDGAGAIRPATREELATLPVLSFWGLDVIRLRAELALQRGQLRNGRK